MVSSSLKHTAQRVTINEHDTCDVCIVERWHIIRLSCGTWHVRLDVCWRKTRMLIVWWKLSKWLMNTSKLEHGKKFWGGGKGLWFLLKPLKVNHIPSLGKAAMTAPGLLWDGPKSFIDHCYQKWRACICLWLSKRFAMDKLARISVEWDWEIPFSVPHVSTNQDSKTDW